MRMLLPTLIPVFRKAIVVVINMVLMLLLWVVSIQIGALGGDAPNRVIFHLTESDVQLRALYGAVELIIGAAFFVSLGRQLLPRGIKQLLYEEPLTLVDKARYLPGVFALGMIAGFALQGGVSLAGLFF